MSNVGKIADVIGLLNDVKPSKGSKADDERSKIYQLVHDSI